MTSFLNKEIQEDIRQMSKIWGVHDIGFCHAQPFFEMEKLLVERKEKNRETDFESVISLEDRIYPKRQGDKAKSFIALVLAYNPMIEFSGEDLSTHLGKMAIGTNFLDYHQLMMEPLLKLKAYILDKYQIDSKAYCDISPFSDRAIGRRCGLGQIGRNSFLIHPQYGTWFFIGYLLSDFELLDAPQDDGYYTDVASFCGSCRSCVINCPNQAILGDGQIDGNKCISYQTQKKGADESGLNLHGFVYGCDICQRVCPKNHQVASIVSQLLPYEPIVDRYLKDEALLTMSNKVFKESFGKSSAGWRGKKTIIRNLRIAYERNK